MLEKKRVRKREGKKQTKGEGGKYKKNWPDSGSGFTARKGNQTTERESGQEKVYLLYTGNTTHQFVIASASVGQ